MHSVNIRCFCCYWKWCFNWSAAGAWASVFLTRCLVILLCSQGWAPLGWLLQLQLMVAMEKFGWRSAKCSHFWRWTLKPRFYNVNKFRFSENLCARKIIHACRLLLWVPVCLCVPVQGYRKFNRRKVIHWGTMTPSKPEDHKCHPYCCHENKNAIIIA